MVLSYSHWRSRRALFSAQQAALLHHRRYPFRYPFPIRVQSVPPPRAASSAPTALP